jgi:hypothetical protein
MMFILFREELRKLWFGGFPRLMTDGTSLAAWLAFTNLKDDLDCATAMRLVMMYACNHAQGKPLDA